VLQVLAATLWTDGATIDICVTGDCCNSVIGWWNYNVSAIQVRAETLWTGGASIIFVCQGPAVTLWTDDTTTVFVLQVRAATLRKDGAAIIFVYQGPSVTLNGWCNYNVCAAGASCNPVDGRCKCKPGYAGTRCEQLCPEGYFGQVSSTFVCYVSFISTFPPGSVYIWLSCIRNADPDPGAWKLTKIYK
jgi:hypothetical protein